MHATFWKRLVTGVLCAAAMATTAATAAPAFAATGANADAVKHSTISDFRLVFKGSGGAFGVQDLGYVTTSVELSEPEVGHPFARPDQGATDLRGNKTGIVAISGNDGWSGLTTLSGTSCHWINNRTAAQCNTSAEWRKAGQEQTFEGEFKGIKFKYSQNPRDGYTYANVDIPFVVYLNDDPHCYDIAVIPETQADGSEIVHACSDR